jgi:hypothetical protein
LSYNLDHRENPFWKENIDSRNDLDPIKIAKYTTTEPPELPFVGKLGSAK